ncbi:YbhB/YbcL family Raf kinase inhibitor-like protein [Kutzneria sp. CA-103260]|uniref:YbhB/YbcL family Raf kinase inhibitor-like protein n=1 Tax=Kutzneria sp. CA-103260 TaxID=2802641 RepID=UPI001BEEE728|nr:YbhB/YbcL family Raf kinase inhibitor-like protein [Kutzneria sp. CA-103260]QUQ65602.1 Phosphatidylethanolamine-binding protein [Kutzneria sp. CA-103260]
MIRAKAVKAAVVVVGLGLAMTAATTSAVADSARPPAGVQVGIDLRGRPNPYQFLPRVRSFSLTSKTVRDGQPMPLDQKSGIFGVPGGKDISPQLSWSGFPADTKSFVVSMYDPEAPTGSGFWHWVVANIPATTTSLPLGAGTPDSHLLPAGALQLNGDAGTPRYIGAAPPAGSGVHDYYLTVTALNVPSVDVTANTSGALLGFTIDSHTVGRATLISPTRG